LEFTVSLAALGDVTVDGDVWADGSIEPQLAAASGRVRHLFLPSILRYLPGARRLLLVRADHRLDELRIWTVATIDDVAPQLLDAAAGAEPWTRLPSVTAKRRSVDRKLLLPLAAVVGYLAVQADVSAYGLLVTAGVLAPVAAVVAFIRR
jgi:hypothetical protein